ncbi:MAG: ParB N-terminal domain-containing protein [Spirochaetes bacterium]|nr:ParB N-terminal domain-containing protein [Spirochaetota bacterium]
MDDLTPAPYNPRKIDSEAFEKLKESISLFGMVKPVIINSHTRIIVAGHQRCKAARAVGITHVPIIEIGNISTQDEMRINLAHNIAESSKTKAWIADADTLPIGYTLLPHTRFQYKENANPNTTKDVGKLVMMYSNFLSVVIDDDGNVLCNSDFVVVGKLTRNDVLVYKLENAKREKFLEYIFREYGVYNYDGLSDIKNYNQFLAQPPRPRDRGFTSLLYKKYVLPYIEEKYGTDKSAFKCVDFGAGSARSPELMTKAGYRMEWYEPNHLVRGTQKINLKAIINAIKGIELSIRKDGLFDIVILDSVLNSVISMEFEHYVMLCCNALIKSDGVFFTASRSELSATGVEKREKAYTRHSLSQGYFDKNNFAPAVFHGRWGMQKYNSPEMIDAVMKRYFEKSETVSAGGVVNAVGRKPKQFPIEEYQQAIEAEFNFEYPNDYRHNMHVGLQALVLDEIKRRDI